MKISADIDDLKSNKEVFIFEVHKRKGRTST